MTDKTNAGGPDLIHPELRAMIEASHARLQAMEAVADEWLARLTKDRI